MSRTVKLNQLESQQAYNIIPYPDEDHPSDRREDEPEDFKRCSGCLVPLTESEAEESDYCSTCEGQK